MYYIIIIVIILFLIGLIMKGVEALKGILSAVLGLAVLVGIVYLLVLFFPSIISFLGPILASTWNFIQEGLLMILKYILTFSKANPYITLVIVIIIAGSVLLCKKKNSKNQ